MHVLILGGDGYLGWPTAMNLSAAGYDVTVVDNYFRRHSCLQLDVGMLYPLPSLVERAKLWHRYSGREIKVVIGDLVEPELVRSCLQDSCEYAFDPSGKSFGIPEAVIHYAEQPSAPYSQLNYKYANTTLANNLLVTNNLMFAVRDFAPDIHIVKLGTMGEYGTPNIDIEEGWLDVKHKGRRDTFLFPRQAGSLYHTTKIMDTDLLWFGVRMWDLRVTDLMQGPVYGIDTDESFVDPGLRPIFNYDEIFGTVINRFVVQAVIGYPLTVYGAGGQTRGYINLRDTLQCVRLAVQNPTPAGKLKIYNQIMETFSVGELAEKIRQAGQRLGYDVKIHHVENPRNEAEEHYYNPTYQGLLQLGVEPHYLTEEVVQEMMQVVGEYKESIREDVIFRGVKW